MNFLASISLITVAITPPKQIKYFSCFREMSPLCSDVCRNASRNFWIWLIFPRGWGMTILCYSSPWCLELCFCLWQRMREVRIFPHTFCWSYSIWDRLLLLILLIVLEHIFTVLYLWTLCSECYYSLLATNYSLQAYFLWISRYRVNASKLRSC